MTLSLLACFTSLARSIRSPKFQDGGRTYIRQRGLSNVLKLCLLYHVQTVLLNESRSVGVGGLPGVLQCPRRPRSRPRSWAKGAAAWTSRRACSRKLGVGQRGQMLI